MVISLTVNGKKRELDGETDLPTFLRELDVDPRLVAVAYNGEVIPKDQYAGIQLREGDSLEIVRMVGGGSARWRRMLTGRMDDVAARAYGVKRNKCSSPRTAGDGEANLVGANL